MKLNNINDDVKDEFLRLKSELKSHLDSDISEKKLFIERDIPEQVLSKSEVLLDTLLNYLMGQSREKLEGADTKLQNKFFEADFRKQIKAWAYQFEHKLNIEPGFTKDLHGLRYKQEFKSGGIPLVVGLLVTTIFVSKAKTEATVDKIVAGITKTVVTTHWSSLIIGAAVTVGFVTVMFSMSEYKKGVSKSEEFLKADIEEYLGIAENQVQEWLKSITTEFENKFGEFCASNGLDK